MGGGAGPRGYLRAQFLRLKHRRDPMKAIVAVAASMLTAAYYMLRDHQDYHDLGAVHFQRGDHDRVVAGLTRRLHHLGYEVTLRPAG
jgi:transposase